MEIIGKQGDEEQNEVFEIIDKNEVYAAGEDSLLIERFKNQDDEIESTIPQ